MVHIIDANIYQKKISRCNRSVKPSNIAIPINNNLDTLNMASRSISAIIWTLLSINVITLIMGGLIAWLGYAIPARLKQFGLLPEMVIGAGFSALVVACVGLCALNYSSARTLHVYGLSCALFVLVLLVGLPDHFYKSSKYEEANLVKSVIYYCLLTTLIILLLFSLTLAQHLRRVARNRATRHIDPFQASSTHLASQQQHHRVHGSIDNCFQDHRKSSNQCTCAASTIRMGSLCSTGRGRLSSSTAQLDNYNSLASDFNSAPVASFSLNHLNDDRDQNNTDQSRPSALHPNTYDRLLMANAMRTICLDRSGAQVPYPALFRTTDQSPYQNNPILIQHNLKSGPFIDRGIFERKNDKKTKVHKVKQDNMKMSNSSIRVARLKRSLSNHLETPQYKLKESFDSESSASQNSAYDSYTATTNQVQHQYSNRTFLECNNRKVDSQKSKSDDKCTKKNESASMHHGSRSNQIPNVGVMNTHSLQRYKSHYAIRNPSRSYVKNNRSSSSVMAMTAAAAAALFGGVTDSGLVQGRICSDEMHVDPQITLDDTIDDCECDINGAQQDFGATPAIDNLMNKFNTFHGSLATQQPLLNVGSLLQTKINYMK